LSIGYANICSSVQDHRQNLVSLFKAWVLGEQMRAMESTRKKLKVSKEKRF